MLAEKKEREKKLTSSQSILSNRSHGVGLVENDELEIVF